MDVRIDQLARGIVHAIPRPGRGQPPVSRAPSTSDAPPPTELFDANGDGVIENWSIAHGGDSFANFDPPPSGTTGSDTKPRPRAAADAAPARVRGDHSAERSTPAAVHHAHDAYQRDGLGSSPPAPAPALASPAPGAAAAPPEPAVTQPAAAPALRSTAL